MTVIFLVISADRGAEIRSTSEILNTEAQKNINHDMGSHPSSTMVYGQDAGTQQSNLGGPGPYLPAINNFGGQQQDL